MQTLTDKLGNTFRVPSTTIDARTRYATPQSGLSAPGMTGGSNAISDAISWANTFKNSTTGQTTSGWARNILGGADTSGFSPAAQTNVNALLGASPDSGNALVMGGENHHQQWERMASVFPQRRVGLSGVRTDMPGGARIDSPYGSASVPNTSSLFSSPPTKPASPFSWNGAFGYA